VGNQGEETRRTRLRPTDWGNYHFYIRPGKYSYQYYGSGLTTILNTDQTIPAALDTNNVFTGSNTFPTLNVSNAGVFTNTQQNSTLLSNVLGGGVAPTYHDLQASNGYSTDAVAGGIRCPAGGTVVQCNGIAGYARTFNSTGGNVGQSVGGYFTSECSANNARCWGANPVVADDNDITADWMIGVEIDFNSHNSRSEPCKWPAYHRGFDGDRGGFKRNRHIRSG
jgi:hypothetical protein